MSFMIIFSGNNISNNAYYDKGMNRIDLVNEIFYYLLLLFSFAFTLYNSDEDSKSDIGFLFDVLIVCMLIHNAGGMMIETILRIYKKLKKLYKHKKFMRDLKVKQKN